MRFDLTDLSLFRYIVEAGSITHGAERANLALAAASTRVRNMEHALGAPLLVRGRHGITPTQAGRTLLQHARTILGQAERLREDLGAYAAGLTGQVRLLSNTNALTEFLPETLSSFLNAHPHVSVDLEERLSDEIVGLIAEGVGDIGIVAGTRRCRPVDDLSIPQRPFRARHRPRSPARAPIKDWFRGSARPRFRRTRPRERDPALSATRRAAGPPAQTAGSASESDAVCRLVERNVGVGIVRPRPSAGRPRAWPSRRSSYRSVGTPRADHLRQASTTCRPMHNSSSCTCAQAQDEFQRGISTQ
jgi:DNA-binding transcriptional LysR family regulator